MFDQSHSPSDRSKFLESARAAREERERDRRVTQAATTIQVSFTVLHFRCRIVFSCLIHFQQATVRSYLARKRLINQVRVEFDGLFSGASDSNIKSVTSQIDSFKVFDVAQKLIFIVQRELHARGKVKPCPDDNQKKGVQTELECNSVASLFDISQSSPNGYSTCQQFELLCKHIVTSLFSKDPHASYIGVVILKPELTTLWTRQISHITSIVCVFLRHLKPEQANHHSSIATFLNILVFFTSTSSWIILKQTEFEGYRHSLEQVCDKVINQLVRTGLLYPCLNDLLMRGLTRTKPTLKKPALTAIITISLRPMQCSAYADQQVQNFILHIFSVPGLILHLNGIAPEAVQILFREPILKRCIELLALEEYSRVIFPTLEGNYTLCLMANLIHLAFISLKSMRPLVIDFVVSLWMHSARLFWILTVNFNFFF